MRNKNRKEYIPTKESPNNIMGDIISLSNSMINRTIRKGM